MGFGKRARSQLKDALQPWTDLTEEQKAEALREGLKTLNNGKLASFRGGLPFNDKGVDDQVSTEAPPESGT